MDPDQQLRNLRDFLLVYNRMTEICFQRCTSNFNYRNLTMDEERCVDSCAGKLIRSNHRLMGTYVQLMPRMVQRRMEEMETKAKAAEAAASGALGPSTADASLVPETPITTSPAPVLSPSAADVGPSVHGSLLTSAGVDNPVELEAAVSKPSTVPDVTLAAATPLTPTADALNPVALDRAGPSIAGFSQPSIAGAHTGTAHAVMPSEPTSLTADVPALTVAAPIISKSTDSLSGQERAPTDPPPSS